MNRLSRRSVLKGVAVLGGLSLVGPLCWLDERPKSYLTTVRALNQLSIAFYDTPGLGRTALMPELAPGSLVLFAGSSADPPPSGWQHCDGTNGTPDLRANAYVGADVAVGQRLALARMTYLMKIPSPLT